MKCFYLSFSIIVILLISLTNASSKAQSLCCSGRPSLIGLGLSYYAPTYPPRSAFLSGRFWLTSFTAFEFGVTEPLQHGFDWFYIGINQMLIDLCSFRTSVAAGVALPLQHFNRQTVWAAVGVDWCLPWIRKAVVSVLGGIHISRRLSCWFLGCEWEIINGPWLLISVYYYL